VAAQKAPSASGIAFTPTGTVSATNVQAAIAEVAAEATGGGTQTVYVGPDDPGAVGAGMLWVDTSLDEVDVPALKMRNAADDDWGAPFALAGPLETNGLSIRYLDANSTSLTLATTRP
jgi:hypothetical protein